MAEGLKEVGEQHSIEAELEVLEHNEHQPIPAPPSTQEISRNSKLPPAGSNPEGVAPLPVMPITPKLIRYFDSFKSTESPSDLEDRVMTIMESEPKTDD